MLNIRKEDAEIMRFSLPGFDCDWVGLGPPRSSTRARGGGGGAEKSGGAGSAQAKTGGSKEHGTAGRGEEIHTLFNSPGFTLLFEGYDHRPAFHRADSPVPKTVLFHHPKSQVVYFQGVLHHLGNWRLYRPLRRTGWTG